MTFGLLNFLSSAKYYLLLYTPSTISGPCFVPRTFLSKTSNQFSSLSAVPGEMTEDIFVGRKGTYLQFGFFGISPNLRRSLVSQELPSTQANVENRPIFSRNLVFCLLFVDIQPYFYCICLQCLVDIKDGF
jgi:hypothetical protein